MLTTNEKLKSKKRHTAIILTSLGIILLLLIGVGFYLHNTGKLFNNQQSSNGVNLAPPTKEEKEAANTQKETNLNREDSPKTSQGGKSAASVFIVDASQYDSVVEVRGYTSSVIEDGGTCTATFKNPSFNQVSASSTARRDAQTTQCNTIDIPRSSFSGAGTWTVTLSYDSPSSSGASSQANVTIR